MDKDKAIQLLERLQDPEPYEPMLTKDAYDAIQMAIDALSADGDTISREAAVEALDDAEDAFGYLTRDWREVLNELPPAQLGTNLAEVGTDCISRQAAIDAVDSETVSTNPEHFKSSEKFIKFMDDADISSFGIWQWSNGFNTALVATTIQLKKLPSAQAEQTEMIKEIRKWINSANRGNADYFIVDKIEEIINRYE